VGYFLAKTLLTALVVAGVSELSRRYSMVAALLASLPLTSILAFAWMYAEQKDATAVTELSYSIFWLVLPSLAFFLLLPLLLKTGANFYLALFLSCAGMALFYGAYVYALQRFGVTL